MMKLRTSRPRFMPTARSMPSSDFRSSASITKMFTSSSTPAMTEKLPMNKNSEPRPLPACSAALSTLCLGFSTEVPWPVSGPRAAFSLAATASLRGSPASTPPVLETKVKVRGWAGGAAALSALSAGAGPPRAGAAALACRLDQGVRSEEGVAGRRLPGPGPGQTHGGHHPGHPDLGGPPIEVDGEGVPGPGPEVGGQVVVDDRLASAGGRAG